MAKKRMRFEVVSFDSEGPDKGVIELHRIDCTPKKIYRVNWKVIGTELHLDTLPDDLSPGMQLGLTSWFFDIQERGYKGPKWVKEVRT